ncbi:MAG: GNAT family N-acetyltransferase [Micromonosporaceae bacterium]|nr:GNAT family N-acetyltransferase [Micromonosporaceae bacterium]
MSDALATAALMDDEARYWQGWSPELLEPYKRILATCDPLMWKKRRIDFVGRDRSTGALVASLSLYRRDGRYHIGGTVGAQFRRQGYGREALLLVCLMAHRHLGIVELSAGCETTHEASQRWLKSSGFTMLEASGTHTLPNGRVIDSCWWRRRDGTAKHRCPNFPRDTPDAYRRLDVRQALTDPRPEVAANALALLVRHALDDENGTARLWEYAPLLEQVAGRADVTPRLRSTGVGALAVTLGSDLAYSHDAKPDPASKEVATLARLAEAASAADPSTLAASCALGLTRLMQNRPKEAKATLEATTTTGAGDTAVAVTHAVRGMVEKELGDAAAARRLADAATRLAPESPFVCWVAASLDPAA